MDIVEMFATLNHRISDMAHVAATYVHIHTHVAAMYVLAMYILYNAHCLASKTCFVLSMCNIYIY